MQQIASPIDATSKYFHTQIVEMQTGHGILAQELVLHQKYSTVVQNYAVLQSIHVYFWFRSKRVVHILHMERSIVATAYSEELAFSNTFRLQKGRWFYPRMHKSLRIHLNGQITLEEDVWHDRTSVQQKGSIFSMSSCNKCSFEPQMRSSVWLWIHDNYTLGFNRFDVAFKGGPQRSETVHQGHQNSGQPRPHQEGCRTGRQIDAKCGGRALAQEPRRRRRAHGQPPANDRVEAGSARHPLRHERRLLHAVRAQGARDAAREPPAPFRAGVRKAGQEVGGGQGRQDGDGCGRWRPREDDCCCRGRRGQDSERRALESRANPLLRSEIHSSSVLGGSAGRK